MEYLTERGNAFHQNVHTLIPVTISVMEVVTKRRNVTNNVVQVCQQFQYAPKHYINSITEKPYWGTWEDWTVCSKKCGGGISYRKRKCIPSKCPYSDPRYNKCDGSGYEEKKCNEQCCPGLSTIPICPQTLYKFNYRKTILGYMGGLDCL